MSYFIDRQKTLKHIEKKRQYALMMMVDDMREASIIMRGMDLLEEAVMNQPSAQLEPLTDKEQRIFTAEIGVIE